MSTITFDTHKFVKKLESAGASAQLAEALVQAQQEALAEAMDGTTLASRQDLKELELRLAEKMSDNKADVLKWVAGMLLAQAAVIATLVKLI